MKVPFIFGPNDLRLSDVETPKAGPRDVVLQVGSVGVCGTDLGLLAMGGVGDKPMPLGHELAGTVVEAGAEVASVRVGDRVVLNPLFNMIGNGAPEGGFAERLLVRDVVGQPDSLLPLPEGISFEMAALIEPLAVATHAANRLGAKPGDKVAIFGAGAIGLTSLAVLRHRGVEDIVVFDLSAYRRGCAERLGARAALDPSVQPAQAALVERHGAVTIYGAETPLTTHYLEATGAPILPEIIASAAPRATICVVALHKKPEAVEFRHVMAKELTLVGTMGYPTEFADALGTMAGGHIDLAPMISHRFDGGEVLAAFETAKQADRSAKVLVNYGG